MKTKFCRIHNREKIHIANQFRHFCTECETARKKLRREKNPEKAKEQAKRSKRTPNGRWRNAISAAEVRGLSFTISLENYIELISKPCYYCQDRFGNKITAGSGLDRLDNSIGYEYANCVSCCKICNQIKMDCLTVEETIAAVNAVFEVRNAKKEANEEITTTN